MRRSDAFERASPVASHLATPAGVRFSDLPFSLGVASGEPSPDGFVIWTRLAPKPFEEHGGMSGAPVDVDWTVASDEKSSKVVQRGTTRATDEWAYSVHVEVQGLEPNR